MGYLHIMGVGENMYLEYWGLAKFPFENVPDPEFMYYSPEHEEALVRLLYAIRRNKGAALLTGEIGCGKTTLSRIIIQQLPEDEFDVALMTHPSLSPEEFLQETALQFGQEIENLAKNEILRHLQRIFGENAKNERSSLLIIDEAQLIRQDTFEEMRLLLNLQQNDRFLLTIVLIGQPELKDLLREYPQLDQRISVRFHLGPLTEEETNKYIAFRTHQAGAKRNPFMPDALSAIYRYTEGVPRKINNICDISLLIGYGTKSEAIDHTIIRKVIDQEA